MALSTIMPANSVSGGYEISNSLRFNKADTAVLRKTFSGSPTATQKCTISFWTKLADPAVTTSKTIFSAIKSGSSEDRFDFHGINNGIHGGFSLQFNNGNDGVMYIGTGGNTLVRFRDASAWYHFIIAIDSTQGTVSNRVKVYVNGVQNEVEATIDGGAITNDVPLTQNYALGFLTASAHSIGENVESAGSEVYDGYLADFNFIDGTQNAHTDFGEVDDNGEWIPKKYTGSYGNYGFFMEFKQTGTGTNASGMGADTSGNDNHFAPVNLVASDVVIDTCTNNFATMNPLLTDTTTVAFSEGNLKTVCTNASTAGSSIAVQNGKWYVEMICTAKTATNAIIGICTVDGFDGQKQIDESDNGGSGHGYVTNATKLSGGASYGATWAVDDIMAVALDLDTAQNTVTFYKNNASQGAIDIDNALYVFGSGNGQGSSTVTMNTNFGADDTFAGEITSAGNTDANGYGLFKYAPPSGYYSLCTKNLAEFG
jgi:hypothetical protein